MTSTGTAASTSTTTTTTTSGQPIVVRPGETVIIGPGPGQTSAVGAPETAVNTSAGESTSYNQTQTTTTTANTTTGYYGTGERYMYPIERVQPNEKGYQAASIAPPIRVDAYGHYVSTYH